MLLEGVVTLFPASKAAPAAEAFYAIDRCNLRGKEETSSCQGARCWAPVVGVRPEESLQRTLRLSTGHSDLPSLE